MPFADDCRSGEFHDEEAFVCVVDLDLAEVAVLQQLLEGQLGGLGFVGVAHCISLCFKLSGKCKRVGGTGKMRSGEEAAEGLGKAISE